MRLLLILVFAALSFGPALANEPTVEELKAKAEAARGDQAAELYAELTQKLIEVANQQFTEGAPTQGHTTIKEAVEAAEKARAAAAGSHSRRVKKTEIALRKAARRLDEVRRSLAFEDRPPVEEAVNRIEQLRMQILNQMFAPRSKDKSEEKKS